VVDVGFVFVAIELVRWEVGYLFVTHAELWVATHSRVKQWAHWKYGFAEPWVVAHFLKEQWAQN